MSETPSKRHSKSAIRILINILVFIIVTALALYYILRDNPQQTFQILGELNFFPMIIAFLVVVVINLLEGVSLTCFARLYNKKYGYGQGIVNALIGNFIGCFFKTGATFVQAYTFTKQDVKGPHAASILTMNFLMYQLTLTLYSLVMVFVGYPFVKDIPLELFGGIKIFPLSLIGFGIDAFCLLLIVFLAYCRPLHRLVLNGGINLLGKLHLIKDVEKTREHWTLQLATYRIESKRLLSHRLLMVTVLLINIAKQVLTNSLPYLCFWALKADMNQISFLALFSGSSYLSLITSYLTTGAPEIGFQSIMGYLIQNASADASSLASAANLIWRALTFYFSLIVGGLTYFFYQGSPKKYELLSNTATMYDLEVLNLSDSEDEGTIAFMRAVRKTGSKEAPLLTQKQVDESFARIRRHMADKNSEEKEIPNQDITMTLTLQKEQLAKAVAETQALIKDSEVDEEIRKETEAELSEEERVKGKRAARKEERLARKKAKKAEKARRKLEKMQPKGTKVDYDQKKGVALEGPEIEEEKTVTTHDPKEAESPLEKNPETEKGTEARK
jgi:uncharacterized membrane protein YbhN (UPF0104 family)